MSEPKRPDGTCAGPQLLGRSFATWSQLLTADVAKATEAGTVTWSELLLAKVCNALSMKEPQNIAQQLRTVSDLIDEWTEELDRRIG